MIDWKPFLTHWSRQLMQSSLAAGVDPRPDSDDWLGFKGASKRDLRRLEERLGVALPPSYIAFLKASNGWRATTSFVDQIRPAKEVDWFRVENKNWIEAYSEWGSEADDVEYYAYGPDGAPDHRASHMSTLLQVSDVDDGVYLLNPQAVTPDGEWEAWFFANWVPGAVRFPSFAHLMVREYRSFAELAEIDVASVSLASLAEPSPELPRASVVAAHDEGVDNSDDDESAYLAELIDAMGATSAGERKNAVNRFVGNLAGRNFGTPRPELVAPLERLFERSDDPEVRSVCIQGLTEFAEDGPAPPPLLKSLTDDDPWVVLSGTDALYYFPDERAVGPLCDFVDSGKSELVNEDAISHLGQIGDPQAVPTLVRVLLNGANQLPQSFASAAMALAACGQAGLEALISARDHEDPRIRHAVVVGLDVSGSDKVQHYLDQALEDPDPQVRDRARFRLGKPAD